ncbi:hypothetical protein DFP73DRAFT_66922 [Morchella snyderi]|nr:hypothetical protein DFP73DRAFT_66922 [Morchella snyderi]
MMLEYSYPPLSGPNRSRNRTRSRYSQGPQISPSLILCPPLLHICIFHYYIHFARRMRQEPGQKVYIRTLLYHLLIKGKTLIYICGLSFQQLNFLTGIYIYIYHFFTHFFLFLSSMLGYFALHVGGFFFFLSTTHFWAFLQFLGPGSFLFGFFLLVGGLFSHIKGSTKEFILGFSFFGYMLARCEQRI